MQPASPLVRRLSQTFRLNASDLEALHALETPVRALPGHQMLFEQGDWPYSCAVLHAGWAACQRMLADGRRQILGLSLPGDVVGLTSFPATADHAAQVLSPAQVGLFPPVRLFELLEGQPTVGRALLWLIARDRAIATERLVSLGRRNGLERIAHLFLELRARLAAVGLVADERFACPLTQEELGDTLGLTAIHVNRVLRELRERQLLTRNRHEVTVHDPPELTRLAEFSPDYLAPPAG